MRQTPSRRVALGLIVAAVGATAAAPHTPYGQWIVYRQKHLLVGAHRGDPRTYELAQAVVRALDEELPESHARIARGPRPQRLASLIGSGQLLTAVLSMTEADAMAGSGPPFEGYLPVRLYQIGALGGGYCLYASPDLPADHAWLITQALAHAKLVEAPEPKHLSAHSGAVSFWRGEPLPDD
jgi:hypothetical protein